jgi:hypothetical protein
LRWCPVVHCTNPCTQDGHQIVVMRSGFRVGLKSISKEARLGVRSAEQTVLLLTGRPTAAGPGNGVECGAQSGWLIQAGTSIRGCGCRVGPGSRNQQLRPQRAVPLLPRCGRSKVWFPAGSTCTLPPPAPAGSTSSDAGSPS